MKVIKEGKWNVIWTTEVDCPTCEAKLLVEEGDVKPKPWDNGGYVCDCCVCGKSIPLRANDIALRVREAVDKKRPRYSSSSAWD
jgi:hypothetical protein